LFRLGIPQVAQRLALVLLGAALFGYLGYLLADLYRSRNELRHYHEEQLLHESSQRAQALEYFFSERMKDLRDLAEGPELQTYFENEALGMSLQYGLSASLYNATESLQRFRGKSLLGATEIYSRLLFLNIGGGLLVDVHAEAASGPPALDLARLRPLLSSGGPLEPSLAVLGSDLVASIPYEFKSRRRGHLVALLSVEAIHRSFAGGDDPSKRMIALCDGDQLLFAAETPGALLSADVIRDLLARGAVGEPRFSTAALGPGGEAVSALRTSIGGTRLSLVTFIPDAELRSRSPLALLVVVGGVGALLLLLGLLSALSHRRALATLEQVVRRTPFGIAVVSRDRVVVQANEAAGAILASSARELVGQHWERFVSAPPRQGHGSSASREVAAVDAQGAAHPLLLAEIPATLSGEEGGYLEAFVDLSERKHLESQLRHAQKLESVGQLAAGIAHEINTPAQYVGDSVQFLADSYRELEGLLGRYRASIAALPPTPEHQALQASLRQAEEEIDFAYLAENAPAAFDRATEGISRVASIVGAMKEFAHPDRREKTPEDLNRALQNTLTIARNEYKYVAEVEAQFGVLPKVLCHVGEMNQVFLNLLVNAAHAIADVKGEGGAKGRILVRTACLGGAAVRIDIEDSGCGIPEAIRHRVFDPFFTTKPVGRGTGQGLAIARSVVVDKHGGTLTFESTVGKGSTFTIVLPVGGPGAAGASAAPA
jgi:signal transduction histidine kinase